MVQGQSKQKESLGIPVLDAGLEARLLASEFVTEVRKSPGHYSFTMTDHGLIEFAKAWNLTAIEESMSKQRDDSTSLFPENDVALVAKKDVMLGLKVSHTTLWKWEKAGYLTPVRVGKRIYYRAEDIKSLTKKNTTIVVPND